MFDRLFRFGRASLVVASILGFTVPVGALSFSWSEFPFVEGQSPGSSVVFLAVVREPLGDSQRVTVIRESAGASGATALVPWDRGAVPPRSVWAAVDSTSGAWVVSSPSAELVPSAPSLALSAAEPAVVLEDSWLEVLLVRPGGGLWGGSIRDGSQADRDGRVDGSVRIEPSSLDSLEDAPALTGWMDGDVLVTIDLDTLAVSTWVVGGAM